MRAIFGEYFIAPARLLNPGQTNAAIEECEIEDAEFYDVFFRGTDGVVEHVETIEDIALAVDTAAALNRRYYATA